MAVVEQPETVRHATGAVRSSDAEGTRYDLISPIGLRRVAEACAEGARKYSDYNWEKGFPIHDLLNHVLRHCYLYLSGDRSEDHLGHASWGMLAACHSEELWPHLNAGTLRGPGCTPPLSEQATPKATPAEPAKPETRRDEPVTVEPGANGALRAEMRDVARAACGG